MVFKDLIIVALKYLVSVTNISSNSENERTGKEKSLFDKDSIKSSCANYF